ncbi:MAG: MJ1477/TM1410 family putative glycoside hydrolase [bacterium]
MWLLLSVSIIFIFIICLYGCSEECEIITWSDVNDFVYQLQEIDLSAIGNTKFDLVIIDYSRDGTDKEKFTNDEIIALKNSSGGSKLVVSYINIGEAENYRWYWDPSWDEDHNGKPDPDDPPWLGEENPEWPGNYKVKYWYAEWQAIIFSYVDKVIDAGFDGVYLDIIDAYEYWGSGGESGLERETAEQEMIDFVKAIADYARNKKGNASFGVFPQNGEGLSTHSDYVQIITGIGREDTWYTDNDQNSQEDIDNVLFHLDVFKSASKLVLCTDYVAEDNLIDDFYAKAIEKGYVPYATTRELDTLTINKGHELD